MADDLKIKKVPKAEEALPRTQLIKPMLPRPLKAPRSVDAMLDDIKRRFPKTIDFLAKS